MRRLPIESENGFSLVELMICALVFLPLLGAVFLFFTRGVNYYSAEQRTAQMNEEARMAVEVMSLEIAQAGARRDHTTTSGAITGSLAPQPVSVASSNGFYIGDSVTVEPGGAAQEDVVVTGAGANTITGVFLKSHLAGSTVALFAPPYMTGIVPPAGTLPNTSAAVTVLRFYGDFYENGDLYYIEYAYDSTNQEITKSITPLTQASKNAAEVLIRNVTVPTSPTCPAPCTRPFTLYSDNNGAITSLSVSLTVTSAWQWKNRQDNQRPATLAARLGAPSVAAASAIMTDSKKDGLNSTLPTTPTQVATWSVP